MNNRITRDELNTILDEELQEFPGLELPVAFTDRLISRLEKRLAWRELFFEFALKTVLVAGALGTLAGVLLFSSSGSKSPVVALLENNWQVAAILTAISFSTFVFDQLFLRMLFRRKSG